MGDDLGQARIFFRLQPAHHLAIALPQQAHIVVGYLATVAIARQPARFAVDAHPQRLYHIRVQKLGRPFVLFARHAGVDFLFQQAQRHREAVQRRGGGRRAAGNIDIHRHDFIGAAPYAVEVVEDAATVAAGTVGDTDFRVRRGLPRAQRGRTHRPGYRPGKQQNIGVTRRRHHFDPKTLGVEQRRKGSENLDLAAVAAAAVHPVDVGGALNFLQQRCLHAGDGLIHRHRHRNAVFIARA